MKRTIIYTRETAPLRYLSLLEKVFKGEKCDSAILKKYGCSRQTSKVMEAMGILDNRRKWLTLEKPSMELVEKIIRNNNEYHKRYIEVKEAEAQPEPQKIDVESLINAFKALPEDLKHKFVMETMKLVYL